MRISRSWRTLGGAMAISVGAAQVGSAQVVYSNNFQAPGSENNGLTASGTLSGLTLTSLPTDNGGIGSANQSMWLGKVGYGVTKTNTPELVTLALSGLVTGQQYRVSFDLLIGGSWDGSAIGYGPDQFSLVASGNAFNTTLVDATFSNCGLFNQLCGASSPQTYSDLTPLGGAAGAPFAPTTGMDFGLDQNYPDYSQDYAIYYFSHGAGNPFLSFVADGSTASLAFSRVAANNGDSSDEYWALDNIEVSAVVEQSVTPEPASLVLLATGMAGIGLVRRKRK